MLARIEAASYPPLVLEVGATDAEGALAALAVAPSVEARSAALRCMLALIDAAS